MSIPGPELSLDIIRISRPGRSAPERIEFPHSVTYYVEDYATSCLELTSTHHSNCVARWPVARSSYALVLLWSCEPG